MTSLNLYVAKHPRSGKPPRLIVARTFAQAGDQVPPGWDVKIASRWDAYRLGRAGIELEYANPNFAREVSP